MFDIFDPRKVVFIMWDIVKVESTKNHVITDFLCNLPSKNVLYSSALKILYIEPEQKDSFSLFLQKVKASNKNLY